MHKAGKKVSTRGFQSLTSRLNHSPDKAELLTAGNSQHVFGHEADLRDDQPYRGGNMIRGFATTLNVSPFDISIPAGKKGFLESQPIVDFISHSESCSDASNPPHGTLLGRTAEGVAAYSNDSSNSLALETCRVDSIATGLPWQCVEFARRWLLQTRDLIFADVPLAANMWSDIDCLTPVSDEKNVPLDSHPNGSNTKPENGDLLVYSGAFLGTGHVAVVVGCDSEAGVIRVAEQNYSNRPWPGDYSREIPLLEVDGNWWLLEPYLSGWKRAHQ